MRTLMVAVMAVVAMAATGCSTTAAKTKKVYDLDKIGYVNANARLRAMQVYWVHPPEKRVERDNSGKSM